MTMNGLVVLSTYLGLAGVKESRRAVIRQQAPVHLFKITNHTTFLTKKAESKKAIYAAALVSGNYRIVCWLLFLCFYVLAEPVPLQTLENYLSEGPFDSKSGYARENWPGVIEVKVLDTKRAHEKPERADGGSEYVR